MQEGLAPLLMTFCLTLIPSGADQRSQPGQISYASIDESIRLNAQECRGLKGKFIGY